MSESHALCETAGEGAVVQLECETPQAMDLAAISADSSGALSSVTSLASQSSLPAMDNADYHCAAPVADRPDVGADRVSTPPDTAGGEVLLDLLDGVLGLSRAEPGLVESQGSVESRTQVQSARKILEQLVETNTLFAPPPSLETSIAAVRLIGAALSRQGYKSTGDWIFERKILPHIQSCWNQLKYHDATNVGESDLRCLAAIARALSDQSVFQDAEEMGRWMVTMRETTLGKRHPDTLMSMVHLAGTFEGLQRWREAEEMGVIAFAAMTEVLGAVHPYTIHAMGRVAHILVNEGWWIVNGEDLGFEQLRATRHIVFGTPISESETVGEATHRRWWVETGQLLTQVLEMASSALGQNHPESLNAMACLESAISCQGRPHEAQELARRVLVMTRQELGETHPETLEAMANLAETFVGLAGWREAEEIMIPVVVGMKEILGETHQYTLQAMSNLAAICSHQDRWMEAEVLENEVVTHKATVYGQEHIATLDSVQRQLIYKEGMVQAASTPPQSP